MDIKNGDIITLDNGAKAIVTLEIIETVTTLVINKVYQLKHTGQFCHVASTKKDINQVQELENNYWRLIALITTESGLRYIFINTAHHATYLMFSTKTLDFVIKEIK